MFKDPVANLISTIKNALVVRKDSIIVQYSRQLNDILNIMAEEGYINSVEIIDDNKKKYLKVNLKYLNPNTKNMKPAIQNITQLSKTSLHQYYDVGTIPYSLNGLGITIISTSKGIMTDKKARELNVGGEGIAIIW